MLLLARFKNFNYRPNRRTSGIWWITTLDSVLWPRASDLPKGRFGTHEDSYM